MGENGEARGEVTTWEPPLRFCYVERDWAEGAPPVATEITVTARSGDRCVVRMVHSLFASTDDWDDQMESFESGWPGFFKVLGLYLEHFAGMKAAIAFAMTNLQAPQLEVWKQLTQGLDLAGADVGEGWTLKVPDKLSGIIEHVEQDDKQRYILLRLNQPAPGVVLLGTYGMADATSASVSLYLYGDDAEQRAAESGPKWRDWLEKAVRRA